MQKEERKTEMINKTHCRYFLLSVLRHNRYFGKHLVDSLSKDAADYEMAQNQSQVFAKIDRV